MCLRAHHNACVFGRTTGALNVCPVEHFKSANFSHIKALIVSKLTTLFVAVEKVKRVGEGRRVDMRDLSVCVSLPDFFILNAPVLDTKGFRLRVQVTHCVPQVGHSHEEMLKWLLF